MLHKHVNTETRSNSETKIWHLRNNTLLKVKYQYLTKLLSTSKVSVGSFVCGCQKKTSMAEMKAIQQQMVEAKKKAERYASSHLLQATKRGLTIMFTDQLE